MNSETRFPEDIPDEKEYPSGFTAGYEILECLADKDNKRTLLVMRKTDKRKGTAKCFLASHPLYSYRCPESIKKDLSPMPAFFDEFRNEHLRVEVWEYIEGLPLSKAVPDKQFTESEVCRLGMSLCDQLMILHSMDPPVIHRDIKPGNVILQNDCRPVLIDFDIARIASGRTTDTMAFGTQGFAPPEQYGFSETDERSDIYSLGVLLYWLLHGTIEMPEKGETDLEDVLIKCGAFDPDNRYTDVGQVKKELGRCASGKKRHRRQYGAAGAAVLLLATVLLIYRASGSRYAVFSSPVIEEAVRLSLGTGEGERIPKDRLPEVRGIYISADVAFPDEESFYNSLGRWPETGIPDRGTLSDLSDLSSLPGLEGVCISCEQIEDISVLKELKFLSKAELKINNVRDISALSDCPLIRQVGLNGNPAEDLSPLCGLTDLAILDLCDADRYDPEVFARLGDLDFLDISNKTGSWKYLGERRIGELKLSRTDISDLSALSGVNGLYSLEIAHTEIKDISPLNVHQDLRNLDITGLKLSDLSVLKNLPSLESVRADENLRPAFDALGNVSFVIEYI